MIIYMLLTTLVALATAVQGYPARSTQTWAKLRENVSTQIRDNEWSPNMSSHKVC